SQIFFIIYLSQMAQIAQIKIFDNKMLKLEELLHADYADFADFFIIYLSQMAQIAQIKIL
ncbi:MAG: hypothetical protein PHW38_05835, partial [Candidatus Cloacimonetes bacterium]